jgi:predicted component of type VI protein secretion system
MSEEIRTYLVGRQNRSVSCDIAIPEREKSVSRKHLEITVTASGTCYIVHVHPKNTTKVLARDGTWVSISQDYVEMDAPLLLGEYRTTARQLLDLLGAPASQSDQMQPPIAATKVEWDPERGTFLPR